MPLNLDLSHFVGSKVQDLSNQNLHQQEEIEGLKMKNAILHIKLAETMHLLQQTREKLNFYEAEFDQNNFNKLTTTGKLKTTQNQIQDVKKEMVNFSQDLKFMINEVKHSCATKLFDMIHFTESINQNNNNVSDLESQVKELSLLHDKEKQKRKRLHNTLIELRGNIRVQCRMRPFLHFDNCQSNIELCSSTNHWDSSSDCTSVFSEDGTGSTEEVVRPLDDETISVLTSNRKQKNFQFEKVFFPQDNQEIVFEEVKPLMTSLLDGYNVCVMAYGQTGSGKTHSMLGNPLCPGIVPRAAQQLFKLIEERKHDEIKLEVSVAEVYNNEIYDLLCDDVRLKHDIVTEESGKGVPTLQQYSVNSSSDIEELMKHGLHHRAKISTQVHEHSSRSHLIVTITATTTRTRRSYSPQKRPSSAASYHSDPGFGTRRRRKLPQIDPFFSKDSSLLSTSSVSSPTQDFSPNQDMTTFKTKLQLVDLAGSECVGLSGVKGSALRESSFINRSLSALADVLGALSEHRSHVPYRNSKLTHLLQDSIGGDAKMLVLLCVSPSRRFLTETLHCLGFGSRARQVQRGPPKRRGDSPKPHSPRPTTSPRHLAASNVVRKILP